MKWLQNNNHDSFVATSAVVDAAAELINVVVGDQATIAKNARLTNVVVFPGTRIEAGAMVHQALATPDGILRT